MITLRENRNSLAESIVWFCRFARSKGLPVGTQQVVAALEAALLIGVADRQRFSFSLRSAICVSHEEWLEFDRLFEQFWNQRDQPDFVNSEPPRKPSATTRTSNVLMGLAEAAVFPQSGDGKLVAGASAEQRLKKIDFADAPQVDMAALEKLSIRLLRQMSLRLSRRTKIEVSGERVDLRRSIRRSITRGLDPMRLVYKGRKPQKKRLVLFLDISGSMNLYSLFLLRFAYALQKHFRQVNTFVFSTGVVEITEALRARTLSDALTGVSERVREWSGGTRIGTSLRELNRNVGRRVLSRNTFFIILSDGWDTGAPEALAAELRKMRSRVQKLVWLNPLLGLKDYQPLTRCMSAALPHVDVFAPGHNLESLLALEKYL